MPGVYAAPENKENSVVPIYVYECPAGHRTEQLVYSNINHERPATVKCAHCDARAKRVPTAAAAHFKGEGFDKRSTNERRIKL